MEPVRHKTYVVYVTLLNFKAQGIKNIKQQFNMKFVPD